MHAHLTQQANEPPEITPRNQILGPSAECKCYAVWAQAEAFIIPTKPPDLLVKPIT